MSGTGPAPDLTGHGRASDSTGMKRPAYRIEYAAEAEEHLSALTAREATTVLDTVPRPLGHEPTVRTRNR
jgi:hypothetical protein